jgi:hypothetical protein
MPVILATESGDSDQEDCGLKPAQANSSWDPILEILNTKRTGGVAEDVGPEFKPQYHTHTHTHKIYIYTNSILLFKEIFFMINFQSLLIIYRINAEP